MHKFICGLDLGQSQDYTAIAILESIIPEGHQGWDYNRGTLTYHGRHLQRFALGTSYPDIVSEVNKIMQSDQLTESMLVVDATGVGAAVIDMLNIAGLFHAAVTITGGEAMSGDHSSGFRVPKKDIIGSLQVLLQSGRLKFAEGLPEVPTLVREMMNFQVKITASANATFGAWREGTHDDLVLAVGMAAWYGERFCHSGVW